MKNPIHVRTQCVLAILCFTAAHLTIGGATAQETPAAGTPTPAAPETPAPTTGETPSPQGGLALDVNVVARQLDIARSEIQPSLGATVYDFSRQAIEAQPQGDNQRSTASCCRRPVSLRIRSASCMSATSTPTRNSGSMAFSCRKGSMSSDRHYKRGSPTRWR